MVRNIIISNVTTTGATIAGKVPYILPGELNEPKVYTLVYDQANVKTYVNGELISTNANVGNCPYLGDIFLGADFDDASYFKGILPTIAFYDKALADNERILLENWNADRWLPTGVVMSSGYVVQTTAGTKPTWTTTLGQPFMDFDSESLILDGSRVTSWNDSTTLGTNRVATPKVGTTAGIRTIKTKNALYFDNATFLKIPILDTIENSPDQITIMFVAQFDNFDTSSYVGQTGQTVLGANSHTAIRIKKYDADSYLSARFTTGNSGNSNIIIPRNKVITTSGSVSSNSVILRLSQTSDFTYYIDSTLQTANGLTNYGVTKHTFSGLLPNTKYYGQFIIDGVVESGNTLSFSTFNNSNNSFKILVGSCNQTSSNHPIWNQMLSENANIFVHLGDLNYLNIASSDAQVYATAQDTTFSSPNMINFFKNQAISYIYDNHDSLGANPNNTFDWTTFIPFFDKAYPTYPNGSTSSLTDGHYWSFIIGRTRCIITGMRSKRDPIQNTDDATKTILGSVQKAWLKSELLAAKNAGQSIIWFGGICYIADIDNPVANSYLSGGMSWGNSSFERREIANFIFDNEIPNVTYAHGDSHMIAIDDGRNAIYSTSTGTIRRVYKSFEDKFLIRNLAASPFDKDQDKEGGPFQITDVENSGGPISLPIDSNGYSQAYGKIEVTDIGENWQQVRLSNVVWNGTIWSEYQSYTFNSPMSGVVGVAPAINNSIFNQNGYIGKISTWNKINKRYIGYNNTWKEEKFKFIGENGYWKLCYTGDEIKKSGTFYVTSLEGYTLERENSVSIYGSSLLDNSIISPKSGGYYELTKNLSDLFENFSSGNYIGTPTPASIVASVQSLLITGTTQGFQLPIIGGGKLGASDIFGTDGLKKYTLSINVYIPSLPTSGNFIPLFSFGNRTSGYEVVIDSVGAIIIKSWVSNVSTNLLTPSSSATIGWNVITLYSTSVDIRVFNKNSSTTPLVIGVLVLPTVISINDTFNIGTSFNSSNVYYSVVGTAYRYFYNTYVPISSNNISKLNNRKNPEIVLVNSFGTQSIIANNWINSVSNTKMMFTIPPTQELGEYGLYLRYNGGTFSGAYSYNENESFKFPIKIRETDLMSSSFTDNFSDPLTLRNNYYILNKAWGGANGGVVAENVLIRNGELILKANGDRYTGTIQGVDRDGNKKLHTDIGDPLLNQPWINRVGACVVYNKKTGFGSYEIETMIPNKLGVAYAIWTFFYNEIYPSDSRYSQFTGSVYTSVDTINIIQSGYTINNIIDDYGIISYGNNFVTGDKFVVTQDITQTVYTCTGTEPGVIYYNPPSVLTIGNTFSKINLIPQVTPSGNEGLHEQGSVDDGFYVTRNHEIDIEFPSHLDGGVTSNPSLSNMKCNTWRGELQNWNVPTTDPTYYEEYRDNLTPVGFNIADGNYHKLRFDWYPDRVEYYIDGVLKKTNVNTSKGNTIPDIAGFFTFGLWFPSSKQVLKPWLVNPTRAWAGGVIDADGGMKADFDTIEMKVKNFTFTPFPTHSSLLRLKGETYPFGGYNKK